MSDQNREDAQHEIDRWDDHFNSLNESAIKAAEGALRAGLYINGGAALAVLAFIGNLAGKDLITASRLSHVANSLVIFAFGVVTAVIGMGLSYVTHFLAAGRVASFKKQREGRPFVTDGPTTPRYTFWAKVVHISAFAAGLLCIAFFIWGMIAVRFAVGAVGH